MRGKYGHQRLKNQNLADKISDKILFRLYLNKAVNTSLYKAFSALKTLK